MSINLYIDRGRGTLRHYLQFLLCVRFLLACSSFRLRFGWPALPRRFRRSAEKMLLRLEHHVLCFGLSYPRERVQLRQTAHMNGRVVALDDGGTLELLRSLKSEKAFFIVNLVDQHGLLACSLADHVFVHWLGVR